MCWGWGEEGGQLEAIVSKWRRASKRTLERDPSLFGDTFKSFSGGQRPNTKVIQVLCVIMHKRTLDLLYWGLWLNPICRLSQTKWRLQPKLIKLSTQTTMLVMTHLIKWWYFLNNEGTITPFSYGPKDHQHNLKERYSSLLPKHKIHVGFRVPTSMN